MQAQKKTRSEVLAASLEQARADLAAAREARAYFDGRCRELRALAAEQESPVAQSRYINASVIQRGQCDGMDREIGQLLQLIEDLERAIAQPDVQLSAAQCEAMDECMTFNGASA